MHPVTCRQAITSEELAQCFEIRNKVFVQEQQLFERTDQDERDGAAIHLAAFCMGRIIGTVRVYRDSDGNWWGGRLAVLKRYRGRAGRELVYTAVGMVKQLGARRFCANILKENINFFKSIGWRQIGEEFQLQGRPHLLVEADIASNRTAAL